MKRGIEIMSLIIPVVYLPVVIVGYLSLLIDNKDLWTWSISFMIAGELIHITWIVIWLVLRYKERKQK